MRVREQRGLCVGVDNAQGWAGRMGRGVGGAAVRKGEGVAVHRGGDESLRAPVAVVAVPFCVRRRGMLELKPQIKYIIINNEQKILQDQKRSEEHRPARKVVVVVVAAGMEG